MVQEGSAIPPPVMWAQRSGVVFLTICLEDCKSPEIKIEPDKVYFKGIGGTDQKLHEIEIPLYKEIDPEKSEKVVRDRIIELTLRKKNDEGSSEHYWPHLTKEKAKYHWLKVDFNRWKDEESSTDDEEEGGDGDRYHLADMMKSMVVGGGDSKANTSLDDLESESSDSDDEEPYDDRIPELE